MTSKNADPNTLSPGPDNPAGLSASGRYLVIVTAFLGWFFGGTHMAINGLAMRTAGLNLLVISEDGERMDVDRETLAAFRQSLDLDGDGVIQTAAFPRKAVEQEDGGDPGPDLAAVGLKKNPDVVKVLGEAGDRDGVISEAELEPVCH